MNEIQREVESLKLKIYQQANIPLIFMVKVDEE